MRRIAITSTLLIVVLAMTASACVAGWGCQPLAPCARSSARRTCPQKALFITTAAHVVCGPVLKSLPDKCSMRSFVVFQLLPFQAVQIRTPLRSGSYIPLAFNSGVILSSIGPSETDRGPPRS